MVTEEYEKAAIVRDQIKELEMFILESNINTN
ncbi:UvrB/UvrC motif-containing protein [Clostridium saccharobutylicum]|nr:UvrB/UvrC motif-containing protein [Clostridium saccharobutylicum]